MSLRTEKFFKSHAMRFRQGNFVPNIGNKEVLHRCIASVYCIGVNAVPAQLNVSAVRCTVKLVT